MIVKITGCPQIYLNNSPTVLNLIKARISINAVDVMKAMVSIGGLI